MQKSRILTCQWLILDHNEVIVYVQDCPQSQTYVHKNHVCSSGILPVPYISTGREVLLEHLVVLDENDFENHLSIRIMPSKVKDDWIHGKHS
eukprot:2278748-Ditylum_brightwellii.AAC.1